MENLVQLQNEDGVLLQQLITNIKKAPQDRRTLDFYLAKVEEMDSLWTKLNQRDNQIRRSHGDALSHPYFVNKFFEEIAARHNTVRNEMLKRIEQIKLAAQESEMKANELNPKTAAVNTPDILRQRKIIETVQQMLRVIMTDSQQRSSQFYSMKLKTIEQHWKHAQILHERLWTSTDSSNYDFEGYLRLEENINSGIIQLQERINNLSLNQPPRHEDTAINTFQNHQSSISAIKLPRIELPTFNGNYLQWRQYRDLFIELVDKQSIPLCQKMWYLKSSLSGEAASLIQHFSATASNYSSAWQMVNDRFENCRLLRNALLNRLLTQPQCINNNSSSIKSLHDTTQVCLLSLQNVDINIESWDPILLHILVQRLSKSTHYGNNLLRILNNNLL